MNTYQSNIFNISSYKQIMYSWWSPYIVPIENWETHRSKMYNSNWIALLVMAMCRAFYLLHDFLPSAKLILMARPSSSCKISKCLLPTLTCSVSQRFTRNGMLPRHWEIRVQRPSRVWTSSTRSHSHGTSQYPRHRELGRRPRGRTPGTLQSGSPMSLTMTDCQQTAWTRSQGTAVL